MNIFQEIRQANPIIHCLTNPVSANLQANGLLTLGASPIMSESSEELEELVPKVSALSLNIGTVNQTSLELMLKAGKIANNHHIPVVLDPVGAGFTAYRTKVARELLQSLKINLVRSNAGEFAAIAGIPWKVQGVDAGEGDKKALQAAFRDLARKYQTSFAITGEEDLLVTEGGEQVILGGHPLITQITGTGCLLSTLCAAALAVSNDPEAALTQTLKLYKEAAKIAAENALLWGDFYCQFMNALFYFSQPNFSGTLL